MFSGKTQEDARRLADLSYGQTGKIISDGIYKAVILQAGFESLFDRAMTQGEADLAIQNIVGRLSVYPSQDGLTPETQVVRHVFRSSSNERLAVAMIDRDESEDALMADAVALSHLLGDLGAGSPIRLIPNPVEDEKTVRSNLDGRNRSEYTEGRTSWTDRLSSAVSAVARISAPFMGNGASAEKKAEKSHERANERAEGWRDERVNQEQRRTEATERQFKPTGFETSAILFRHLARHYEIPMPAELARQSWYRPDAPVDRQRQPPPSMSANDLREIIEEGGQSARHDSLKVTEWALLKATYRATEQAVANRTGKEMSNRLRFQFENGYTKEIVDHLATTFSTDIWAGKLTDGVVAYYLALCALTFHSAADRFTESLAEYANEQLQESRLSGRVEVDPAFNPIDHPDAERVDFRQLKDTHTNRIVSTILDGLDAPVFRETDANGESRFIVASHYIEAARMSVRPSGVTYPIPGSEPPDPDQAARERQAAPLNTRLARNALTRHFGVEGRADPTRILKTDAESVWATMRMHQGELPDMTPDDERPEIGVGTRPLKNG